MRALKHLAFSVTAAVLLLSPIMTIGFAGVVSAVSGSDTCTWTGATDLKFSTATNWSGCSAAAPVSGDSLVLVNSSTSSYLQLNNDITNLSIAGLTVNGSSTSSLGIVLNGQPMSLTGNATLNRTFVLNLDLTIGADVTFGGNSELDSYGNIINIGNHTLTLANSITWSVFNGTGNVIVATGQSIHIQPSSTLSGNLTITDGANATFCGFNGANFTAALNVGGTGFNGSGALYATPDCGMLAANSLANIVLTGRVTLTSDTVVGGQGELKITGSLSGNHTISMKSGDVGTLTIASSSNNSGTGNGAQASATQTTVYSANNPTTPINVNNNQVGVIDGIYGDVYMYGGIVQGTGTVKDLFVNGGIVAPGHSPGKLTILQTLTFNSSSTYQAELKNATDGNFDQLVVGDSTQTTGNAVTLGDAKLDVQLYAGASIKATDTFKIIDNKSGTAVLGTFFNLPEGATFKVGIGVLKITYKGGDGNDVVLSVVTVPTTPDTGFGILSANPVVTLLGTLVAVTGIAIAATKLRTASVRR